jgi:hypothetical protein
MFDFINKIKFWLGLADINRDGKVNAEDGKILSNAVKAEAKKVKATKDQAVADVKSTAKDGAKKVKAAKDQAVAEIKDTVKRGRPAKTD